MTKKLLITLGDNMTKKLLITLGDSWTHGVGCYTPEYLERTNNLSIHLSSEERKDYDDEIEKMEKQYSWPSITSRILNYDLKNLGIAGFTNPGIAKTFINDKYANFRSNYDEVVLVFLLTDPHRFSLYLNTNGNSSILWSVTTRGFTINEETGSTGENLYKPPYIPAYIHDLYISHMIPHGAMQETLFSIRAVEYFAKSCGYKFHWGTAFTPVNEIINKYKIEGCLHPTEFDSFKELIVSTHSSKGFSRCSHPNPLGYDCISRWMVNKISQ
jgi:hypothetical protein